MPKRKTEVIQSFGERLAQLRKGTGFTQAEFAAEVGITQRMVAYYEAPDAHPPAHLLPQMAQVLGVSADVLLGVSPAAPPKETGGQPPGAPALGNREARRHRETPDHSNHRYLYRARQAQAAHQHARGMTMTTLEMRLTLSERLAKEARAAGLLNAKAIEKLLREAVRRQALRQFLSVSDRVAAAGITPMSLDEIQVEVNAVRKARRAAGR